MAMTREAMVKAVQDAAWSVYVGGDEAVLTVEQASAIVDAILPQVTTVAELEALPPRTLLLGKQGTAWRYMGIAQHRGEYITSMLADSPLTVVWQP